MKPEAYVVAYLLDHLFENFFVIILRAERRSSPKAKVMPPAEGMLTNLLQHSTFNKRYKSVQVKKENAFVKHQNLLEEEWSRTLKKFQKRIG